MSNPIDDLIGLAWRREYGPKMAAAINAAIDSVKPGEGEVMLIAHPFTDATKRLAELLWAYEADEPHYHCDRGPGYYPTIAWDELWPLTAQPHEGDCVGLQATCRRCVAEEVINKARWVAERLPCPAPASTAKEE